ncbi:hypothetical protein PENTCL1PPCAC_15457, partial [Pristionchus entomophagus]
VLISLILYEIMYTTDDVIHIAILWTLDILAIATNFLLIVAMWIKTPTLLRSYSVFLLNNAIVDLTTATVSALAAVRVVEDREGGSSVFVFLGPCSHISEHLCRLCHAVHVNLMQHSMVVVLLSFAYRLYIIGDVFPSRPTPTRPQMWLICALSLFLMSPLVAGYYLEQTSVAKEVLRRLHLKGYSTANFHIFGTRALCLNAVACLFAPAVMPMIFLVRRKLLMQIIKNEKKSGCFNNGYFEALTYQMLLPIGAAVAVFLWLCDITQIWSSEFSERFIMVMFNVFSLASPPINFTILPPYRTLI